MIDSIIRLARKESAKSPHGIFKHAAFVVKGGTILSSGFNHDQVHAEVSALNKLWPNKRKDTIIWSIRITRSGKISNAKPCKDCEVFLRKNGIKTVYYSTGSGNIEKVKYI